MGRKRFQFIGRGVYTLREASRLSGISVPRIRRWTQGYTYVVRGERRDSPPIIGVDAPGALDVPVLTFADLIEVQFLNNFLQAGVSWRSIRVAAQNARELLQLDHPFSSRTFHTDGQTIMARIKSDRGDVSLLDLVRKQYGIVEILDHTLSAGIEWKDEDVARWWPLPERQSVVVDPARSFGAPIIASKGVPTAIVARMRMAESSAEAVAEWFDVTTDEVRDAVRFETRLAA